MEAPIASTSKPDSLKSIKEYTLLLEKVEYNIIIGLSENKNSIIFRAKLKNDFVNCYYESNMDLNDLVKLNKIFFLYEKIDDAFDFINGLFNENKIYLKEILNNEILFCVLQFYLPNGKTQEAIIKLLKKDLNKDSIIDNLCKNLNDLKNEFNNYKKETNERISKLENLVNQLLLDKKP